MSVYACLGNDAAAIRDAFLTRLQSKTEDMRIKVMILEFLTVAVETQPGLIELFLNLEVKDGSEGSKVLSAGIRVLIKRSIFVFTCSTVASGFKTCVFLFVHLFVCLT